MMYFVKHGTEFFARIDDNGTKQPVTMLMKIKQETFPEAVQALEDIAFLERKGHPDMAIELSNGVACLHCSVLQSTKQSTLNEFSRA